jgi:hypothetical protein
MKLSQLCAVLTLFALSTFTFSAPSFADAPPQAAALQGIAQTVQAAPSLSTDSVLSDAIAIAGQVKGSVPIGLKIAGIVLLLIALMKVSFLAPVWKWFGAAQVFLAPTLGLILGLLLYGASGSLTLPSLLAYFASGGGAVLLHEILDAVKAIPGLGAAYVSVINMFEGVLGGG